MRVIEAAARHLEDGAAWIARQVLDLRPRGVGVSAKIPRPMALCEALEHRLSIPLRSSAITRAGAVTPALLTTKKRAGLVHVNFGVQSGDDQGLRVIGEGLATACNFMLGFPGGYAGHARARALRLMERMAPWVDFFSTLGVALPFPGAAL